MITLPERFDANINCVCFIYDFSHGQSIFFKTFKWSPDGFKASPIFVNYCYSTCKTTYWEYIQFIHYEFLFRIQSISARKSSPVIDMQSQMFSSSHGNSWNHAFLPSVSEREHIDALPDLSLRRNRFVSSDDIVLYLFVTFDILNLSVSSRPMADLEDMSSIAFLYGQRESNNLSVFTRSHEILKSKLKPRGFLINIRQKKNDQNFPGKIGIPKRL